MPLIALAMPCTTSRCVFTVPATTPYTTPGTRKKMKISGTIERISGAVPTSSELPPSGTSAAGARQAEPSGSRLNTNTAAASPIASTAISRPRLSAGVSRSSVGICERSPSTSTWRRRGSITRSVRNQPTSTISAVELVVK